MPGERLRPEQRSPAAMQNHVIKKTVYKNGAWTVEGFDKEKSLQPLVKNIGGFKSAVRKWVTNYWYIKDQCSFVTRPNGTIETFPDTWGLLALQLFFDRYSHGQAAEDISVLVAAVYDAELHKLIGVPEKWLDEGLEGAADMFVNGEVYTFEGFEETKNERKAAQADHPIPKSPPGSPEIGLSAWLACWRPT